MGIRTAPAVAGLLLLTAAGGRAQLIFTDDVVTGPISSLEFGDRSGIDVVKLKVFSLFPTSFQVSLSAGTSLAGNWIKIVQADQNTDCSDASLTYGTYPVTFSGQTPAYLCVADIRVSTTGYYPGYLLFNLPDGTVVNLPAELVIFPPSFLRLGAFINDQSLSNENMQFSVGSVSPPVQSVYATVADPDGTLHNNTPVSATAYDLLGNQVNWIRITALQAADQTPFAQAVVSPVLYQITIDPAQVPQGTVLLAGYVQIQSSGQYQGSSYVNVAATIMPALTLSDTLPIILTYPAGPLQKTLNLGTNGPDIIFAALANSDDGTGWLQVSPFTGTVPSTQVTVTANVNSARPSGSYTGSVTITPLNPAIDPLVATVRLDVSPPGPAITSVSNSASGAPAIAPGGFFSVYGSHFGVAPSTWTKAVVNDRLPTNLNGIQVRVNGQPAYISYASDTQINAVAGATQASGDVPVKVTTPQGTVTSTAQLQPSSPGIFQNLPVGGKVYAVAVISGQSPVTFAAPVGAVAGAPSRPVRPGEIIMLYATGLGRTTPAYPDGMVLHTAYPMADLSSLKVRIGGVEVIPSYAGMTFAGLYQVNLQVPDSIPDGDQPITLEMDSVVSPSNVLLAVAR